MILVKIQPTESTVVRSVVDPSQPPALVITEGTATVWFAPRDHPDGPGDATEFAERLLHCTERWFDSCRALVEHATDPTANR